MTKLNPDNPSGFAKTGRQEELKEENRIKAEKWDSFEKSVLDARGHAPYDFAPYEEARSFLADDLGAFYDWFNQAHPDEGPGEGDLAVGLWKRLTGYGDTEIDPALRRAMES